MGARVDKAGSEVENGEDNVTAEVGLVFATGDSVGSGCRNGPHVLVGEGWQAEVINRPSKRKLARRYRGANPGLIIRFIKSAQTFMAAG